MDNKNKLHLIVRTKEGVVFEEEVISITSYDERGIFDILGMHENFISVIRDSLVIKRIGGEEKDMKIGKGLVRIVANRVNIYLGFGGIVT